MKKILIYLIIILLLNSFQFGTSSLNINKINNKYIFSQQKNVKILLNEEGISYGHELLWIANTTGTNYEESAVVYLDGIAYIASCSTHGNGHDSLFAINTLNGEILWKKFIGPGYVGPVIDDDVIYIGTSSHGYDPTNEYVYAVNRHNGIEIWNRNIYGGIPESIQFDDEKIYFTSDKIYALNKFDGSIIWTFQMDSFSVTKPLLKDNYFYTATSAGSMYKIDVDNGNLIWKISLSHFSWDNSITADGKGNIFLALYGDKTINAYNEIDGSLIWSYHLHGNSLSFNAYHNGILFISDIMGYVYALNSTTGSLIWEKKIGDTIDISSPTLSSNLLFIGTRDFDNGAFFVLDEKTGDILWRYNIGASVTCPPSIADGMMFCGSDGWFMYAFDFGIGSDDWTLHRYDKSNTAYSQYGLTTWQYVKANCTTNLNITYCNITNYYDHEVFDITLILSKDSFVNWYDKNGNLLKSNSNNYTIDNLPSLSFLNFIISKNNNSPPFKPIINGPSSGKLGVEYEYIFTTIDPDNDDIYYLIQWFDEYQGSYWEGPYKSGQEIKKNYSYSERGTHIIKVKAKDINGMESDWSTFEMKISLNRQRLTPIIWFFERLISN